MKPRTPGVDVLLVGGGRREEEDALLREGLTVKVAGNSHDALGELHRARHRVLVISAAELSGKTAEALRAFRNSPAGPEILVTVPTHRRHLVERLVASGADETLPDPHYPRELVACVLELLERRRRRAAGLLAGSITPAIGADKLAGLIADVTELSGAVSRLERRQEVEAWLPPAFEDAPGEDGDGDDEEDSPMSELLESLLLVFRQRCTAQRASIMFRRGDLLHLTHGSGLPEGFARGRAIPLSEGLAGLAVRDRRPILVPDLKAHRMGAAANGGPYRTDSCLVLPLVFEGRVLAVLSLADKERGEPFTEEDLAVLGPLADQGARTLYTALGIQRWKELSLVDGLTGLHNKRYFLSSLGHHFRLAERHDRPLAVAVFDLDHFSDYNNRLGHPAGDRLLRQVAGILQAHFRVTDVVSRWGGEEFAVVFPETRKGDLAETSGALGASERLRLRIEEIAFEREDVLRGGRLTISGGVAGYPDDADTAEALFSAADAALLKAKKTRNRVVSAKGK